MHVAEYVYIVFLHVHLAHLHVSSEHISMKTELYQSNINIQGLSIELRSSTIYYD